MANDFVSEITAISEKMNPVLAQVDEVKVTNEDEAAEASVFLAKLKTSHDIVENKRLSFTAPLNASLKEINGFFNPVRDAIKAKMNVLSRKIIDWKTAENEKIAKEEARRQAISDKAAEKRGEENTKVVEVERVEKTIGMATTKKGLKKFRVIDFSMIQEQFKMVDEVKLNAFIRNKDNADVKVPGIEIYQDTILSAKGL